jgi:hypothetical protein
VLHNLLHFSRSASSSMKSACNAMPEFTVRPPVVPRHRTVGSGACGAPAVKTSQVIQKQDFMSREVLVGYGSSIAVVCARFSVIKPQEPDVGFAEIDRSMSHEEESSNIEGKYANYFKVGHNAFEFIVDFGQLFAEASQEKVHTRIITSPTYARELLEVLRDSVQKYERTFGEIRPPEQQR